MQPIRVLHVVTYMGRGGLETMIMNYYRRIDREKVQFDFLVHRDFEADYDREIEELGGRIYHLPPLNPFSPSYLRALDAFFAEHTEYRIVHSHLDCMAGIPLKYAKKHGVPVRIAHAHNSNQTRDKKYVIKLCYKKNIKIHATDLFACGQKAGQWMFDAECFSVLNNAIDSRQYTYDASMRTLMRKTHAISENAVVIGHVGRFMTQKNHAFLLDVFSELCQKESDICLLLVGDGELRIAMEQYAKDLGIDKQVIFAGNCGNVHELLQAMDVFVFPSLYEGLPLSIVEAQAAGLPCLISDKVPLECQKTDLVQQLDLDAGATAWAERVLSMVGSPRRDTSSEIVAAGFDIVASAQWLQEFYLEEKGRACDESEI